MLVRLVDRNRNVIFDGKNTEAEDKFGAIRTLMASCKASSANPHLEFEMDREFFDALNLQSVKEQNDGKTENVLIEMQDGRNLPSFEGIPIVVEGRHAPEMSLAAFKGA